jgi:hypothetical protein
MICRGSTKPNKSMQRSARQRLFQIQSSDVPADAGRYAVGNVNVAASASVALWHERERTTL